MASRDGGDVTPTRAGDATYPAAADVACAARPNCIGGCGELENTAVGGTLPFVLFFLDAFPSKRSIFTSAGVFLRGKRSERSERSERSGLLFFLCLV